MVNLFSFFQYSLLFLCFIQLPTLSSGGGFTVDLIHRDSPLSPLYNASQTNSDRVKRVFHISNSRAAYFKEVFSKSTQNFHAQVIPIGQGYIIVSSIGTPPTPFYAEIDTGSDLSWTQCSPCNDCYNQSVPFFNPTKSSTYNSMSCSSPSCQEPYLRCSPNDSPQCSYEVYYGDNSYSFGDVAFDTFTFGSTSVPNLLFGCGHTEEGTFSNSSTGLIGFGGGNISFSSQMKELINGKFSYCFVHYDAKDNVTGKMSFGDDSVVSGPGVISTPLVPGNITTFYQLTLNSVKIGNNTFPYPGVTDGNIVIDSGTTLTYLPGTLVSDIESELKQVIKGSPIPDPDPEGLYDLCYNSSTTQFDGGPITFEFAGAELEVPQSSAFIENDNGVVCLGIVQSDHFRIFGNMLQVNFQVGYDLVQQTVSFKQTDCSQQ